MTYGFQTHNADGSIGLDTTEVALRFVSSAFFGPTFSGTISMPNFDSTRGNYALTSYYFKFDLINDVRRPDTDSMAGKYYSIINTLSNNSNRFANPFPTLSWNNTTKLLTVTPIGGKSDFRVLFFHHK